MTTPTPEEIRARHTPVVYCRRCGTPKGSGLHPRQADPPATHKFEAGPSDNLCATCAEPLPCDAIRALDLLADLQKGALNLAIHKVMDLTDQNLDLEAALAASESEKVALVEAIPAAIEARFRQFLAPFENDSVRYLDDEGDGYGGIPFIGVATATLAATSAVTSALSSLAPAAAERDARLIEQGRREERERLTVERRTFDAEVHPTCGCGWSSGPITMLSAPVAHADFMAHRDTCKATR